MLALMMQDEQDTVRAAFSTKVFKLVLHFLRRPSTHQLSAKYAAILPLGAVDPSRENKDAAARQLREWVHSRRQAVQQQVTAAAAAGDGSARGGGSTLQDLPEMILPYGLYILAHHPDHPSNFPEDEDAQQADSYDPFQFMLQFMLQPLLVPSAGMPAGATLPALVKMCKFLKRTADTADEPCTEQLYTLCDLSVATMKGLADHMGLDRELLTAQYPGSITLPKGLYRPLDKEERGADDMSYLPPDFKVTFDPEPAAALAQPQGKAAGAAGGHRGRPAGTGRGSKHRAQRKIAADAAAGDSDTPAEPKRAARRVSTGGAGVKRRASAGGGARAKRAADDSDDGWEDSDKDNHGDASPSAQQLTKRQQLLQQQKQQQEAKPSSAVAADSDQHMSGDGSEGESPEPPPRPQHQPKQQQQRRKSAQQEVDRQAKGVGSAPKQQQRQRRSTGQQPQQPKQQGKLKQQPLAAAYNQAAAHPALADASSPAPVKSKPRAEQLLSRRRPAAATSHSGGGSSADDSEGAGAAVDSPAATGPQQNGTHGHDEYDLPDGDADDDVSSDGAAAAVATKQHSQGKAAAKPAALANGAAGRSSKPQAAAVKRPKSATADSNQEQDDVEARSAKPGAVGGSAGRTRGKAAKSPAVAGDKATARTEAGTDRTKASKAATVKRPAAAASSPARATRRRAA
eukprot:GHUV01033809.1.p1 GENE.GHUV01033809.1~~GHUV01033809.1.p1  ORF type:complete len:684 (+),score=329.44 GHUV01033809.1:276-2327(+)